MALPTGIKNTIEFEKIVKGWIATIVCETTVFELIVLIFDDAKLLYLLNKFKNSDWVNFCTPLSKKL